MHSPRRGAVARIAFLVAALGILLGIGITHLRDRSPWAGLWRELRSQEVPGVRLSVASRFRGCATGSPLSGDPGGCAPAPRHPSRRALRISHRAVLVAQSSSDPAALHAAAVSLMLLPDARGNSLYRSISYLESASRLAERPAPVLADLAAAHLMLAERGGGARHLVQALEAAGQAVEMDPANLAAQFNTAVSLDRIGLRGQALQAWGRYLRADPASAWAAEARRRERALSAPPPPRRAPPFSATPAALGAFAVAQPREGLDLGWDGLLVEWGDAVVAGDTATARARLAQAGSVGDSLVARRGDGSLADAVAEIRRGMESPATTRRNARAHAAYGRAHAGYVAFDHAAACPRFRQVAAGDGPAVLQEWARTHVAICMHYGRRTEDARRVLADLAPRADGARYPALAGRRWWALGSVQLSLGRYEEGLATLRRAYPLLQRAGEREFAAGTVTQQGYAELQLGDAVAGYASLHHALTLLRDYPGTRTHYNLLYAFSSMAAMDGLGRVAMHAQDEAVASARGLGAQYRAEAALARARLRIAAGRGDADADLRAAEESIGEVDDEFALGWLLADLRQTRAEASLALHPDRTAAELDSVIRFFTEGDAPFRLVPALFARAEANLALQRPDAAALDLRQATAVLDRQRSHFRSAEARASLLEVSRRVFDRAVMLAVHSGRELQALDYVEQSRASFSPVGNAPDWIRRPLRVAAGHAALELALVGDTLLAWTLGPDGLHLHRSVVSRLGLLDDVERVRSAMERRAPDTVVNGTLEALYDRLIRPLDGRLGPAGPPLVIVADGELSTLPMAALRDRVHGRYLVEAHSLRFASSLRDPGGVARAPRGELVTLIADPAFDRLAFPGLEPLSQAAEEVAAVGRAYPGALHVERGNAGADRVRAAFERGGIAHFAGHAVFDDARPERSFLVTAASAGRPARLTAAEIATMRLEGLRLVVLSACQSARAQSGRSGGFAGLSGAFLSAGAGGVVGSLWRVDDGHTRVLMEAFHDAYRATGNAAEALRTAQLGMLRSGDPRLRSPAAWASFRYAGR